MPLGNSRTLLNNITEKRCAKYSLKYPYRALFLAFLIPVHNQQLSVKLILSQKLSIITSLQTLLLRSTYAMRRSAQNFFQLK